MSAQHTPGPLEACGHLIRTARTDESPEGWLIAECAIGSVPGVANAERIVQCVNAHDELVAATECALALEIDADEGRVILERHGFNWDDRFVKPATSFVAELCRAAIAKAGSAA